MKVLKVHDTIEGDREEQTNRLLDYIANCHFALRGEGESWLAVIPRAGGVLLLQGADLSNIEAYLREHHGGEDVTVFQVVSRQ